MQTSQLHAQMRTELAEKALFEQVTSYAYHYMDEVSERAVYPTPEAIENLAHFDEPVPEVPQSGAEVLRLLHEFGSPATTAQTGGRYFGFVNGNVVPTALAARWLADTWDQNTALYVMSPIVAQLERVCEQWVVDLLGLPAGSAMGIVGGTSTATMCGLAAARYELLKRQGWDVNANGLFGAPLLRVVVSEQAHGTVLKALALLGLGKNRIERVPADEQGRLKPAELPTLDAHTLLILQAGHVSTGSFDDFTTLCDKAKQAGAWVHIDGAFGLWAAVSPSRKQLTEGIANADSWSVDGHKTLNTPYDCGLILCKERNTLVAAMQASGEYIQYSEQRDSMMYVPDMSRRARAVGLWATLRYLGKQGIAELIDGLCERAAQFGSQLQAAGFHVLNDVVFNQVLVRCDTPTQTQATLRHIQQSGECWCGATMWNGEPAIRISVCSWATTEEDVNRSVQAFIEAREQYP